MTLEKILIFGFALAVFTTVTALSRDMVTDRKATQSGWKQDVQDLRDLAR
ncbi:hypothetical protein GQ651_17940 [Alphaproteobacteria bacterium GH1-50]|uniref:Uncharacterized protein n=1 Tax=Kangsaoukella pontilimi TaxID=2691042 RepID=A0A7C9MFR3_9RHOB|nr:hypothetical protein [Kangsaoukella pontilimi]MXQ09731.1 hypothetical protein [Kangsaoukella pontilimi]